MATMIRVDACSPLCRVAADFDEDAVYAAAGSGRGSDVGATAASTGDETW